MDEVFFGVIDAIELVVEIEECLEPFLEDVDQADAVGLFAPGRAMSLGLTIS